MYIQYTHIYNIDMTKCCIYHTFFLWLERVQINYKNYFDENFYKAFLKVSYYTKI